MKKDENRFTIRFNTVDPRQRITRDALEAAGRRKALLITDAICEYLARHGGDGAIVSIPIAPSSPQIALTSSPAVTTSEIAQLQDAEAVENRKQSVVDILDSADDVQNDVSDNIITDDDMRETILGGLNAFKL